MQSQLRWTGHVLLMKDTWLPKCLLYGELSTGKRPTGKQYLGYKDTLKRTPKSSVSA